MRAFVRAISIAALLVAATDVGAPTVRADLPEMGTCVADAELIVGSVGSSVYCVQWTLAWKGLYGGPIDGNYTQQVFDGVISFQQANPPLTVNGHAGEQTLSAMGIYSGVDNAPPPPCLADAPVSPGDRGPSAECVQNTLKALGVFSGNVDGSYGNSTRDAVKAYQQANPPLTADGVAGTQTLAALGIWSGFTRDDSAATFVGGEWWPASIQAEPTWRVINGIPQYGNRRGC
ncbi:MAG: peptidoglycan-binding domain-containing protein, partial [Actinomycetota bacterium]|nr:peptidoglycan-binding domain-containing protein [Actinomycetota bacterium]